MVGRRKLRDNGWLAATARRNVGQLVVTRFSEDTQTPPERSPNPRPVYSSAGLLDRVQGCSLCGCVKCQDGEMREKHCTTFFTEPLRVSERAKNSE